MLQFSVQIFFSLCSLIILLFAFETTTEVMLDTAKEEFLKNNFAGAYRWALSVKLVDPFFDSVDCYLEVYHIHFDHSHKRTKKGEINWYAVLNFQTNGLPCQTITHRYVKIAKMINLDEFQFVVAPGAMKLITTAWEIAGEDKNRSKYHVSAGFKLPDWLLKSPPLKEESLVGVEHSHSHHGCGLCVGF